MIAPGLQGLEASRPYNMPLCLQWARRRETRYHEAAERREQTTSNMAFRPTRRAAGAFTEHTTYIRSTERRVRQSAYKVYDCTCMCQPTTLRDQSLTWPLRLATFSQAPRITSAVCALRLSITTTYAPKRDPPPASRLPNIFASHCFCQPRYRCPKPLQPFTDCHSSLRYYWLPSATCRSPAYADELHPSQGRNKAHSESDRPAYLGSISTAPSPRSYMCMFLLEAFREYPKAVGELLSYYTGRSLKTRGH